MGQGLQEMDQGVEEVGTSHCFFCIMPRMYASITGKRGSLLLSVQQALAFVTHCRAVTSLSQFSVRLGCIHIIAVFKASCLQEAAVPGGGGDNRRRGDYISFF